MRMLVIVYTLLLISITAFGDEAPNPFKGIETKEFDYVVLPSQIVPGYTVDIITQGIPIGRFAWHPLPTSTSLEKLKDFFAEINRQKSQQEESVVQQYQKLYDQLVQNTPSEQPQIPKEQPINTDNNVLPLQMGLFYECAKRTLPELKILINATISQNTPIIAALALRIDSERGDGEKIGAKGIACGKYIGKSGSLSHSMVEDVKILTSLTARQGEEAALLFKAYVASHHREASVKIHNVWQYYWNKLSFKAAFQSKALPKLSDLAEALKTRPVINNSHDSVTLLYELGDVDALTKEGLEFANARMQ